MKFHTGFSILLVLLLGLLCASPIKSYYYEEEDIQANDNVTLANEAKLSESSDQQQQSSLQTAPVEATETSSAVISSAVDDDQPNEKRSGMFGIPSSRGIAEAPQQVTSSNGDTSEPLPSGENSSSQQQQEDAELSQPANTPLSSVLQSKATQGQESSPSQDNPPPASTGRGLGSVMNGVMNNINNPQPYQANPNQQKTQSTLEAPVNTPPSLASSGVGGVRKEDLPTIIENNKPVSIEQQIAQQQQQQKSQQSQKQSQDQQTPSQQTTAVANQSPANMSTARTFGEGWTNCVGASTGKYGTCKNDVECKKNKGVSDGSCMGGLGMCCVMALTCGDKSYENNTFFANPDFPEPSWEARLCEVEIKKKHSKIVQIMIEFEELELAPPNHDGECITDVFQIKLGSSRPSPYSLLRICGQNTGQHMYLDVSQIEETIVLSVATSGGGFPRRWSIRIVQMDEKNNLLAPPGCLQYYTDTIGHFRSFNLGRNLRNLYYAICFRIDNGYSGIRFTSNFFGMNGFGCKHRLNKPIPSLGGRHNGSYIEAHPHHLVIPPSGYAPPLPPPKPKLIAPTYQHQAPVQAYNSYPSHPQLLPSPPPTAYPKPHTPAPSYQSSPAPIGSYEQQYDQAPGSQPLRYKRFAYSETSERIPRTFGSDFDKKDSKDDKRFKHDEGEHFHHLPPLPPPPPPPQSNGYGPSYPPTYDQKPVYGPQQPLPSYGTPPPPMPYGYYEPPHHHHHEFNKEAKWDDKQFKKIEKWEDAEDKKGWWDPSRFGWKSEKKDDKTIWKGEKKDEKFGWKSEKDELEYGGYGGYGPPPPHHGYGGGPPRPSNYYNGNYGPPPPSYHGYGHAGYGGYGGEYHHKEIDKFGKKYEHLEYKHEKNHLDKEDKKDDKSWWFWNKKEDKKDKEKFFSHHEALFPIMHLPDMPQCEPRFCGQSDVITFPPSGDSISEMCGNRFNRGRGPKIISGSPLVVYVSNRGHSRGAGFDMNYEQVFYVPRPY